MEPESSENFCTVEIDLTTPPPLPPGPAPVQIDIANIATQQTASVSQTSPIVAGTGRLASPSQDFTIVSSKRKSLAVSILGLITDKLIKRHSSSGTADSQTIPTAKSLGKSSQGIGWWVGLFAYIFAFAVFVPMTIVALIANDGLMPVDDVTLTPGVMQGIRQAHMMNNSQVYDNFTASVASLYIRNEDQNLTDAIFTNVLRSELGLIYPTLIQFDATLKARAYQTVNQTREAGYPAAAGIPGFSAVIQGTLASQGVTAVVFLQMVENGIARATIASAERHEVSRNDNIVGTGIQVGPAMQRAYHLSPENIYQTAANAHKNFLVQFFLGTILCPIVLAVQLSAAFGYMTRDYQAMNITYNVTGFIVASLAILGPISAVILRQRCMFGVFKQRTRHSHYFITLPWHVFLNLFIIGVFTFCAIEPENCPVWKRYVPIFVTVVSFALEFIYYTWNVRNASGMFVDIWQSARLLLVVILTCSCCQ
ncbi:hypothetical protein SARC_07494 [Sphaeroforma arctica JP610]|uniref:Uncharacterized protein n=1 Tax=Sphaeroforma arctica JP610 TaxID=667725 RepID=A0A0L0FTM0_9EUKA|nr:hypothetical protein SARC_07494 [Sphaeroforma arctica JP610]KNC80142.1 hypothetical protein SARC_07494 [Sphaeroforma arctica JP610]|eukprot:XP_014154044.1 hypothetical protein SARC_07494 [Sphaeroforma arctica JP610]